MVTAPASQPVQLAARTRQHLVTQACAALESLLGLVQERLTALMDEAAPSREMQVRRDAWMAYQRFKSGWRNGTVQAWQASLQPLSRPLPQASTGALELVGTEVVENRIIASRMALDLMEKAAKEVNDLRRRLKFLNNEQDLSERDIAHPEVLMLPLVEQWEACGLSRESWQLVSAAVQRHFNEQIQKAYTLCNADLIAQGVLPVIDFSPRASAAAGQPGAADARRTANASTAGATSATPDQMPLRRAQDRAMAHIQMQREGRLPDDRLAEPGQMAAWFSGGAAGMGGAGVERRQGRAHGIFEQVGRLLGNIFHPGAASAPYAGPSAPLMVAMAQQPRLNDNYYEPPAPGAQLAYPVVLERVASDLRQQSTELKGQAQTDNEKAIIELVALMFQSILQEDRIPTGVRVWFARLQMPVLRIALAEPAFFNKLDHPARLLIDHMGSCVLGFDASGISSSALEIEIKRVVQVIEQYPETGERVYQKVYEEFQAFLKKHLTEKPSTQKVMGVAQQLEQKETLTIQYTIELRDQLKDMPVREEIREFVFKVWAEVLAVSAVRQGPQHEETLLLKKTASDLIWAASAKPNRADRARVIADLPALLQCLRVGMTLLGTIRSAQETHIKIISDTLADAFMSRTQAIADEQIQALAARLAHLEDYVRDDGTQDLPLDSQNIEDLLGIDASELDVVTGGTDTVSKVMLEWVRELAVGSWFTLNHNGRTAQVQYVWHSPLGHLHLFANNVGHSYLFQTTRLATYLQEGLLEPQEDEPLMARATRDALGKMQANPERLLAS